jgi:hypothetical protein
MNTLVAKTGYKDFATSLSVGGQEGDRPFGEVWIYIEDWDEGIAEKAVGDFLSETTSMAGSPGQQRPRFCISDLSIAEAVERRTVEAAASLPVQLRDRISELAALEPNWDGEGAKAVKPHVLADVVETLKRLSQRTDEFREPFLAPTFDGFVQMEWREGARDLEIEATEKGWSAVGIMLNRNSERYYYTAELARNDFAQLLRFYQWFSADELIWPSL